MRSIVLALAALLLWPLAAAAQAPGENLIQSVPPGYTLGYQNLEVRMSMAEWVPEGQTVKKWTDMVTTQIYRELKGLDPSRFKAALEKNWGKACPDSSFADITEATENGYPVILWLARCPHNPASDKPEFTWFKAIKGNDALYIVQKAFAFEPSKEQIATWMHYLRSVGLCDTRGTDHACPTKPK